MRPKQKKIGKTIKKIQGKKANWEIYVTINKGKKIYGNRLVSKNGYIIINNFGFGTSKASEHNINAIIKAI
jgi:hypothetical protein